MLAIARPRARVPPISRAAALNPDQGQSNMKRGRQLQLLTAKKIAGVSPAVHCSPENDSGPLADDALTRDGLSRRRAPRYAWTR
eukprot:COSAG06_NODE_5601_length_3368_cov_117.163965_1_plen_83_part_10